MEERTAGKLSGKIAVIHRRHQRDRDGNRPAVRRREGDLESSPGQRRRRGGRTRRAGQRVRVVRSDAGDAAETERLTQTIGREHGGIDVLFSERGIVRNGRLADLDESVFDEVNAGQPQRDLPGPQVRHAPVADRRRGGGSTPRWPTGFGVPGAAPMRPSKAALRSLVRTAAAELLPQNVRVNAISPVPPTRRSTAKQGLPAPRCPRCVATWRPWSPSAAWPTPTRIARAVLFLACDDASFMTARSWPSTADYPPSDRLGRTRGVMACRAWRAGRRIGYRKEVPPPPIHAATGSSWRPPCCASWPAPGARSPRPIFRGSLRAPVLALSDGPHRLGCWHRQQRTISLGAHAGLRTAVGPGARGAQARDSRTNTSTRRCASTTRPPTDRRSRGSVASTASTRAPPGCDRGGGGRTAPRAAPESRGSWRWPTAPICTRPKPP